MASDLSANDRGRLAIHTPVWDHNDLGFRLECGCGEFTHGGTDRAAAERRWVEHIAPTVERILTARSADVEARIRDAQMQAWDRAHGDLCNFRDWSGACYHAAHVNPYRALLDAAPAGGAEWPCGGRIVCPDPDCQRCKLDAPSEVPHA